MAVNKKVFILDTNILVHDPTSIFNFADATVGIPAVVLEELDEFKREGTDRGRNTREVIRYLDELRSRGSLKEGVKLENNGILKVLFAEQEMPYTPFKLHIEDNQILLTALASKQQGNDVTFISKDLNARIKADALGLRAEDYLKEYVSEEEFYKGWIRIQVPSVQLKKDFPPDLELIADGQHIALNQFIIVEARHNQFNFRVFRYLGGKQFKPVYPPTLRWPLQPRNVQQLMALDLLLDDSIQFVSLFGPAGTGKTFLALLAGLHKVLVEDMFEKILVSRPVIPLGRDIGYLPGDIREKLHSWMLPIYDNMEFIIHAVNIGQHFEDLEEERRGGKRRHKHKRKEQRHDRTGLMPLDELIARGKVSLEAITYMRGRSIPYQYILIDEAQNLTPHEIKTLITRVGEGSKIIVAGDPYQIDSPYLDFSSNGLVIASEKFKGQKIFGSVFLEVSERSELSKLAGALL
jgi:PhoH-like ATPase